MNFSHFILSIIILFVCSDLQANIQMGLITASKYVGDREVAWRIKISGERLGWSVIVDEEEGRQLVGKELDLVICMIPNNSTPEIYCPQYLMVFHPFNYLDKKKKFKPFYEKYDGYLLTIHDRETLEEGLRRKKKQFHHIPFNPSIYQTPYRELLPKELVVMLPVWGNRLHDPKFSTLYSLLSQSGFARFYGKRRNNNVAPQYYRGAIPFDGVSVIDALQRHGITLVFHSDIHNQEGIPSGRIFEAAAASTVIICDQNPFVKKHFGDAVFYIDTTQPAESIFKQIQVHMQTIQQEPEKALAMAKQAHAIFVGKFTMESQLLQLEALHREVLQSRPRGH